MEKISDDQKSINPLTDTVPVVVGLVSEELPFQEKLTEILDLIKEEKDPDNVFVGNILAPKLISKYERPEDRLDPEKYKKYKKETNSLRDKLSLVLGKMLEATDFELRGKVVVDLGCGSTGGTYDASMFGRSFEPWISRALVEIGAKPIGFDVGNLDGEEFEHHHVDISLPGALDILPDDSADLFLASLLLDSPEMGERDPLNKIRTILNPQIKRVLKDGGAVIWRDSRTEVIKKEDIPTST